MRAEYKISAGIDISGILSDFKKVDNMFDDKSLILHLDYDAADVKQIQGIIDKLIKQDPTVALRIRADLDASIWEAQDRRLNEMKQFTVKGELDDTLVGEIKELFDMLENADRIEISDEDAVNRFIKIRQIMETINELGGSFAFDKSVAQMWNTIVHDMESADEFIELLSNRKIEPLFTKEDLQAQKDLVDFYEAKSKKSQADYDEIYEKFQDVNLIISNVELDSATVQTAVDKVSGDIHLKIDSVDFNFKDLGEDEQKQLNEYFKTRRAAADVYQKALDESDANAAKVNELIAENKSLHDEIKGLRDQKEELQREKKSLEEDLIGEKNYSHELDTDKSELNQELALSEGRLSDARKEAEKLSSEIDATKEALEEARQKVAKLEEEKKTLDQTISELRKIGESEGATHVDERNSAIESLEKHSKELQSEIEKARQEYSDAESKANELIEEKKELQNKVEELSDIGTSTGTSAGKIKLGDFDLPIESIKKFMQAIEELVKVLGDLKVAIDKVGNMDFKLNFEAPTLSASTYKDLYAENRIKALDKLKAAYASTYSEIAEIIKNTIIKNGSFEYTTDIQNELVKYANKKYGANAFGSDSWGATIGSFDLGAKPEKQVEQLIVAFEALRSVAKEFQIDISQISGFDIFDETNSGIKDISDIIKDNTFDFSKLFNTQNIENSLASIIEALNNFKITIGQIEFPEDTSALTAEQTALLQLNEKLTLLIGNIDEKTNAFRAEGQVVDGVVQNEITNLTALDGWIVMLIKDIEELQDAFKKINLDDLINGFDFGKIFKTVSEKSMSESLDGIISSFKQFIETINGMKFDDSSFINVINNIINRADQLKEAVKNINSATEKLKQSTVKDEERAYVEKTAKKSIKKLYGMSTDSDYLNKNIESFKEYIKSIGGLNIVSTGNIDDLNNIIGLIKELENRIKSAEKEADGLSKKFDNASKYLKDVSTDDKTNDYVNLVNNTKKLISGVGTGKIDFADPKTIKIINEILEKTEQIKANAKDPKFKLVDSESLKRLSDSVDRFEAALPAVNEYSEKLKQIREDIKNIKTEADRLKVLDSFNKLQSSAREDGYTQTPYTRADISSMIEKLEGVAINPKFTDEFKQHIDNIIKSLKELSDQKIDLNTREAQEDLKNLEDQVNQILKVGKNDPNNIKARGDIASKLRYRISSYLTKNPAIPSEIQASLKAISDELEKPISVGRLRELSEEFDNLSVSINNFGYNGKNALQNFFGRLRQMNTNFFAMFFSFYDIIRYAREGLSILKDYDNALTEMRKVSDESVYTLTEYQKSTYDVADALGTTALQIQNSTADFMRLGESLGEASKSAEAANLLMNVSEFENISEATDSLIAMSAAYSDLEKEDIVDKMNEIGNNYAISTDGVATALQSSAAALVTAGNDMDEAVALVTAGNVITQDPNKVGTGVRTIALRLTGTKEAAKELEEMGEDTEGVVTTVSKLRDTIMSATKVAANDFKGFDIFDENGNYKSTYEIMLGIAQIYDDIVESDKKFGTNNLNLLLETIAGK